MPAPALAFFDFDKTLTLKDSGELIALRVGARGLVHPGAGLRFITNGLLYKLGRRTRAEMQEIGYATYRGNRLDVLERTLDALWEPCIAPNLSPAGLARLRGHQASGDRVHVLTASPWFVASPAARSLGIDSVVGTQMEQDASGRLTGRPVLPIMEGPAKADCARMLALEARVSLDDCWAYSDAMADLALLEIVGHPVAVGPDPDLHELALRRGWEILPHSLGR